MMMNEAHEIVQLKVRLLGISPMIWRRVKVPADMTLRELHGVCQVAMGWESLHLYAFDIRGSQYGSFELCMGDPRTPLSRFGFSENDKFEYIYDMSDRWEHEIRVERFGIAKPNTTYPVCMGGASTCPPEECGGPRGYLERRDEAEGYEAYMDMDVMAGFLEDVAAADAPDRPVSDFMSEEVEDAMERIAARKPFMEGKFSKGAVNKRFRAGDHRDLMHQQW
ncbi:plasmid pRiA4b ORF-3 family protein [Nitratireductor sp. XY-223]|uniref:plasmid pRiA4b ORF-3 family protein n=1 Tax=Nitratireductor sp. XY-223 TaxID=2561926 RepID=UPI001FEEB3FE|nr:plasmid pRiA4b ORF-3 family protein [Nitratireductor sp. XY-223]